ACVRTPPSATNPMSTSQCAPGVPGEDAGTLSSPSPSPRRIAPSELLRNPWAVFAGTTLFFAALLLARNHDLFSRVIYEDGDPAANTILIREAKHFRLLVGNYSRMGFNHPGPGLLYVAAFCEILLHDLVPLVPTPHNAHMVAALLLNALLCGLSLAMLCGQWKSAPATCAAVAVFVAYFGLTGILAGHWMPHI